MGGGHWHAEPYSPVAYLLHDIRRWTGGTAVGEEALKRVDIHHGHLEDAIAAPTGGLVAAGYASSMIDEEPIALEHHRRSLWDYYDRRVTGRAPGLANAHAYWTGLGVTVEVKDIAGEAAQLEDLIRALPGASFVEVGAGPGTFTGCLAGRGIAVDQSRRALGVLRTVAPGVPAVQADAMALPLPSGAVMRFFSSHLYGLLLEPELEPFLTEAHRVASEVVILDAGCPPGVRAEEWQERTLPEGGRYRVFRRHFEAHALAAEIGGEVLFAGQFYVMVRSTAAR
jgi:SAM-dependent methyltransferase